MSYHDIQFEILRGDDSELIISISEDQLITRIDDVIKRFMYNSELFIKFPLICINPVEKYHFPIEIQFTKFVKTYFDIESQQKVYDIMMDKLINTMDIISQFNHKNNTKSARN